MAGGLREARIESGARKCQQTGTPRCANRHCGCISVPKARCEARNRRLGVAPHGSAASSVPDSRLQPPIDSGKLRPSTIEIGTRAEGAVLAALLKAGYNVLIPFGLARYDLVIETVVGFERVQCKTARADGNASITFSTRSKGKCYDGDIDYFGVFDPLRRDVYMIPFEVSRPRRTSMYLRIDGGHGGTDARQFLLPS